jgi:nitrate reductase NapAB chaperone NapD
VQIESPLTISLEAGGSIKAQFLDLDGEAAISAEAVAKFKVYYLSDRKEFLTFEFEGIEGIVKAKLVFKTKKKDNEENEPEEPEKDPEAVPILSGFKIDIPLFKKTIVENPHKDEN